MLTHVMLGSHPGQAAAGILLDRAFGEPPAAVRPVAWFSRVMTLTERVGYRDSRHRGSR